MKTMTKKFFPTLAQHLAADTRRNMAVTAGAGTGKTEVLTRRIIKILQEERLFLDSLLVLTFTDKAAVEMKERVYERIVLEARKEAASAEDDHFQKLKDKFLENKVSTFHAFCASFLREHPVEAGIDPYFRVMDEVDQSIFLRRIVHKAIKELAVGHDRELLALSDEMSRNDITQTIYRLIQDREKLGPWMKEIKGTTFPDYLDGLKVYSETIIRELCHKALKGQKLDRIIAKLQATKSVDPQMTTKISSNREELLKLLPRCKEFIESSLEQTFDPRKLNDLKQRILSLCKIRGAVPSVWKNAPEDIDLLKSAFKEIEFFLNYFRPEDFLLNDMVEKEGLILCKALAGIAERTMQIYHLRKAEENYLDFQDLQIKTLSLLQNKKYPDILDGTRRQFRYIMVDEFQDTNDMQWDILKLIASDADGRPCGDRLFIVGDEKQAIYSFRGGDVTLFSKARRGLREANRQHRTSEQDFDLYFKDNGGKDYRQEYGQEISDENRTKGGEVIFSDNFRSAASPIRFFNLYFGHLLKEPILEDFHARPQNLRCSGNKREGSIEFLLVDKFTGLDESTELKEEKTPGPEPDPHLKEAFMIADKIEEILKGVDEKYAFVREQAVKGKPAIAILLSRRTKIKTYEEALRQKQIDFIVVKGVGFYQRQEIVDMGNLLTFLNTKENLHLAGFLRSPVGHVTDAAIYCLSRIDSDRSLRQNLNTLFTQPDKYRHRFTDTDLKALDLARISLQRWDRLKDRLPLPEFLRLVLNEGGYYAALARSERGTQALSNIGKLLDKAREMALVQQGDFADFTLWLNERIDHVEREGEANVDISLGGTVQLMTVHQSKGLEFPAVFVPDLSAGFYMGDTEILYADEITLDFQIQDDTILRRTELGVGIDAPDPDNDFEPTATLVKKIIRFQIREKMIAERKRLFYVAATRTMDHLFLVGQINSKSRRMVEKVRYTNLNDLSNWMEWLCRILGIYDAVEHESEHLVLGSEDDERMHIPFAMYRETSLAEWRPKELQADFVV